jgi:hypothetical protein
MYISKEHCKENAAAYTPGGDPLLLLLLFTLKLPIAV